MNEKRNILKDKSFAFAVRVIRLYQYLAEKKKEYVYSQALEYLTECAYNQYDDKLAYYLANRTLFYDPNNSYVKGILKKMKK